jgi:hypothetical protein
MGRPIKKKYFGNTIRPYQNQASGGKTGVGGEGVASVTFSNSGTLYSQGTTVSFGQPNVNGGIRATGTPVIDTAGLLRGVTFTERGTGYTSAPTLTVTTATGVTSASTGTTGVNIIYPASTTGIYVGMKVIGANISASATYVTSVVSGAINLTWPNAGTVNASIAFVDAGSAQANSTALFATTTSQDAIAFTSYLITGSNAVAAGDIIKQESSRRYLVRNSQGIGQVKLSATDSLTAGNMNLIATDGGGSTYYVTKLTAHKATLINRTSTSTALVANLVAGWTLGVATGTNQVSIAKNA